MKASTPAQVTLVNGTLTITAGLTLSTNNGFYVVGDAPVLVDTNAWVSDGGSLNFGGGSLTVRIVTNATSGDSLAVQAQAPIGLQAANVTYGGTAFAALSGGNGTTPLVCSFNTNATWIKGNHTFKFGGE